MRLLLAPHAPTDWNAEARFQGHGDMPLSAAGRHQAALLAKCLAGERIHEVHASDLRRAWETAEAIVAQRRLLRRSDSRLRELHFGAWEGLTYAEVCETEPDPLAAWESDALRNAPPGGETLARLAERVGDFFTMLTTEAEAAEPERSVLVVAHRGSLQVLLCLALGLPPEDRWKFRLEPASISELGVYPQGVILTRFSDTYHLREAVHVG